jgi:hypothetical protein
VSSSEPFLNYTPSVPLLLLLGELDLVLPTTTIRERREYLNEVEGRGLRPRQCGGAVVDRELDPVQGQSQIIKCLLNNLAGPLLVCAER